MEKIEEKELKGVSIRTFALVIAGTVSVMISFYSIKMSIKEGFDKLNTSITYQNNDIVALKAEVSVLKAEIKSLNVRLDYIKEINNLKETIKSK